MLRTKRQTAVECLRKIWNIPSDDSGEESETDVKESDEVIYPNKMISLFHLNTFMTYFVLGE